MMDVNTGKLIKLEDSVSQSVDLILNTQTNARVLNREFGIDMVDYIDLPVNNISLTLGAQIISALEKWDARITVEGVEIINAQGGSVGWQVYYGIKK